MEKIIEQLAEKFREYMLEGYNGGPDGLRCSLCDRKYRGISAIRQLCPECNARELLTQAYKSGEASGFNFTWENREKMTWHEIQEALKNKP
jgi:hypothetical protein